MRASPRPSDPFRAYSSADAARYDAWYQLPAGRRVATAEHDALAAMLAMLPAHDTVVEVGCGSGHFTRWLATQCARVIGVDPGPGMLAVARAAGGGAYVRAAAEALPLADASADVVAFITTLEFLAAPTAALREAARVARGGILLGVLNRASPLGLRRTLAARFGPSVYRAARFYTVWSLKRLLERALPDRLQQVRWTTTLWPPGTPTPVRRLPCGGFIALAATLA